MKVHNFYSLLGSGYILIFISIFSCTGKTAVQELESNVKPNVILILTDDQGYGDLSLHGNQYLETPRLDKLGRESVSFQRFYVEPLCAPSRASILSGKYHLRTGVRWVSRGYENMGAEEYTIAEMFRDAGYTTGCFGKWHNGSHYPNNPQGQGFQQFIGFTGGHFGDYFDPILQKNGEPYHAKGYITNIFTEEALKFINENRSDPFFCYIPYNVPHTPLQVDSALYQKYFDRLDHMDNDRRRIKTAAVYAMCENMDTNVGRILDELDQLKLAENTIVIFLTDNGPNGNRYNAGMNGTKGDVTEGGTRVPFFIRYPGKLPAGKKVMELGAHIDILPTLAALVDLKLPDSLGLDGIDLTPLLSGNPQEWPDRLIYSHSSKQELLPYRGSVRNNKYSLTWYEDDISLYDLEVDYNQTQDLSKSRPALRDSFFTIYQNWYREMVDQYESQTRIQVGYDAAPLVALQAHESFMKGNPRFHGKMGYSHDWIENWTTPNDSIWWEIDVVEAGEYQVNIKYTVPEESKGNVVQVISSIDSVKGKITEAYDPDPYPHRDILPRWGVYEKSFREMKLGTIKLKKGSQEIMIKAIAPVQGNQVADLKALILRKM